VTRCPVEHEEAVDEFGDRVRRRAEDGVACVAEHDRDVVPGSARAVPPTQRKALMLAEGESPATT
jgi:hypothetical protein